MDAQRKAVDAWAAYRNAAVVRVEQDVASGKTTKKRPGLERAIAACDNGEADALVVAKLDRLSRSVADFATIVEHGRKGGWSVVVLDVDIDLTTATGEMVAGVLAVLSQWERRIIGERTRAALAAKREQGVRLGRPRELPEPVRRRIVRERGRGRTLQQIAERLNAEGVPTAHRGVWHAATVSRIAKAGGAA